MKKIARFIKMYYSTTGKCPQCGKNTLVEYDRGEHCTSCDYSFYYP